jgi:hypothetical protein
VISVAFTASRGIRGIALESSPVNPFHKSFFGNIMAKSTADFFKLIFMGKFINFGIHMAADTVQVFMG